MPTKKVVQQEDPGKIKPIVLRDRSQIKLREVLKFNSIANNEYKGDDLEVLTFLSSLTTNYTVEDMLDLTQTQYSEQFFLGLFNAMKNPDPNSKAGSVDSGSKT